MRRFNILFLGLSGFLLLSGFSEDQIVIRVNDDQVVLKDLMQRIRSQSGEKADQAATDRAVESIIANRIVMQEAKRRDVPEVTEEMFRKAFPKSAMTLPNLADKAFQEDWVAAALQGGIVRTLMPTVPISRKELTHKFEELRSSFQPEMADIRWIVVEKPEEADRVMERLRAGEDFGKVAREVSIETVSGGKDGIVGTVRPDKIPAELSAVLFAPSTKAGTLLPPVKVEKNIPFYGPRGFYIAKVDKIVREGETTLEAWQPLVEHTIRKEKAEKKADEILAKRRKQAKIWIEKNLASIVAETRAEELKRLMGETENKEGK